MRYLLLLGLLVLTGCEFHDPCSGIKVGDIVKHKTIDMKASLVIDTKGLNMIWVRLPDGTALDMYCAEVTKVQK